MEIKKEKNIMVIALTIILVTLIICISVLVGLYMDYCRENGIKMFADPRYEERISRLEKILETEEKE